MVIYINRNEAQIFKWIYRAIQMIEYGGKTKYHGWLIHFDLLLMCIVMFNKL